MGKRILIIANSRKETAIRLADEVARELSAAHAVVRGGQEPYAGPAPDFAVVFGGDGTVLAAVKSLGGAPTPILTVNLGRLGFLAAVSPDELRPVLAAVCAGDFQVSERMMLEVAVERSGGELFRAHVLNEVAFLPTERGRVCRLLSAVDGKYLNKIIGDGLVVATPTGSTAYALSAGGPILSPELKAVLMVPICPHRLSQRPLVLGAGEVIEVRDASILACDGEMAREIADGDRVRVRASSRVARLVAAHPGAG
ncbi:MAG: NAD(+)/NADH kinase, partial [Planctomycetes bacterium]|nr:NAD(+)/NADH kinase [Planctomycetota bacterium]